MNYATELKKFATSQSIYTGVRITLAIVLPSLILAHFGILKEYYLFPLATSFIGFTDQAGPYIRRRNALIFGSISFFIVSIVASLIRSFPVLVYPEIIIFGIFFTMIGVYGQRLTSVGSLSLIVLGLFLDGHLLRHTIFQSSLIFLAGSLWYLIIFMIVSKIQPYKLASQMIGENYLELAQFLNIKSKFYFKNPNYSDLHTQIINKQSEIKNLQEATRETVFETRKIVNESTTTSRLLMLMFLGSIDLHEKLMTSENDYRTLHEKFGKTTLLRSWGNFLQYLADELTNVGVALQSGTKAKPLRDIDAMLENIFNEYFEFRKHKLNSKTLDEFLTLRLILNRITDITSEINDIYRVFSQNEKIAKSLSTGLDLEKFVSKEEKLISKVFFSNFSLKSSHFRHAIRITVALLIGYSISQLNYLKIGHSYWIFVTIVAILKPAYATTKHRNLLRLYGTIAGAIMAYGILSFIPNQTVLFAIHLSAMMLCFTFLRSKYLWAVFFMTIYVFLTFNILRPGNINAIFKDRILDTAIAGIVTFAVSYFVLPVWEHTKNFDLMKKSLESNLKYFKAAMSFFKNKSSKMEDYKLARKDAIISLANFADNFQRMISDPKNQQRQLENIHQFVNTSHLMTAYIASFAQYSENSREYPEIDFDSWNTKITAEMMRAEFILNKKNLHQNIIQESAIEPNDSVQQMIEIRQKELEENEFIDRRDPNKITHLTELKNLREILKLIYDVAKEQRKIAENMNLDHQSTIVKQ